MNRRDFTKLAGLGALGLISSYKHTDEEINSMQQDNQRFIHIKDFRKIPSSEYHNISHKGINWMYAAEGLNFSKTEVYREKELVDVIATVKINPEKNKINVFNGIEGMSKEIRNIESWQEKTGALAMINGSQYMSDPLHYPCALVIADGRQIGPKYNKFSKGMLVAEPKDITSKLKKADLLDFDYDFFDYKTTPYTQGVQHWPILLDREGKIKVKESSWQANRTVVAKTKENEILFMTTEGGYFTLYNFGQFLKESNERADKGFNVHTAMNMDGGYEAEMILKTPKLSYLTYGQFENQGLFKDISILDLKINIPGVIGVFKRD